MSTKTQFFLAISACILFPIILYIPALKAPFLFDDLPIIVDNPDIRHIRNLKTRLIYRTQSPDKARNSPTRPLTFFTLTLNYALGGLNPWGYHAVNILIHIFVTILMFFLTRKIFINLYQPNIPLPADPPWCRTLFLPLAVALTFAVHPIHTDVVTHIIHRSDSLATLFYLGALLLFIKSIEERKGYYLLSLFCFMCSFASKQIAASLPFMLLTYDYLFLSNGEVQQVWKRKSFHLPFWILLVSIVVLQFVYLNVNILFEGQTIPRFPYLLTQPYATVNYIKLFLVPWGQCIDHLLKLAKNLFDLKFVLSVLCLAGIGSGAYWFYKKEKDLSKIILFSVIWFFVTLLPSSSLIPTGEIMAEKRVYLAGWGLSLLLASIYLLLFKVDLKETEGPKKLFIFWAVHLFTLSILTWNRNKLYNNPMLLWQEVIARYPSNARAYNAVGSIYHKLNEHEKAIHYYQKAIELDPLGSKAYNNLGMIHHDLKEYEKAVAYYQKAIELEPGASLLYNNLGAVYYVQKDYVKAGRNFRKALEFNPNFAAAYNNIGNIFNDQKKYEQAIQIYQIAVELDPNASLVYRNLGNIFFHQKKYDQAEYYYRKTVELEPEDAETCHSLGTTYFQLNQYEKAMKMYAKAIELNPGHVQSHNSLGTLYYRLKDYGKAKQLFEKAIALSPKFADTYNNLGTLYQEQKEYVRASPLFQKAIQLNPNHFAAHSNLGKLYLDLKQYDQALKTFEEIVRLNPNIAAAHYQLANVYRKLEKVEEARDHYFKTIELDPTYSDAYNDVGVLYLERKYFDGALKFFLKALALNTNLIETHNNLANLYSSKKEYEKAWVHYQKAIEIDPNNVDAHYNLGGSYYEQKKYGQALKEFLITEGLAPEDQEIKDKIKELQKLQIK